MVPAQSATLLGLLRWTTWKGYPNTIFGVSSGDILISYWAQVSEARPKILLSQLWMHPLAYYIYIF